MLQVAQLQSAATNASASVATLKAQLAQADCSSSNNRELQEQVKVGLCCAGAALVLSSWRFYCLLGLFAAVQAHRSSVLRKQTCRHQMMFVKPQLIVQLTPQPLFYDAFAIVSHNRLFSATAGAQCSVGS